MLFNKPDLDTKQRFSIRKLTIGTCSVLLSTLFLELNNSEVVHADTLPNNIQDRAVQVEKKDNLKDQDIDVSQSKNSNSTLVINNDAQKLGYSSANENKSVEQKSNKTEKNTASTTQNSNQKITPVQSSGDGSTNQKA